MRPCTLVSGSGPQSSSPEPFWRNPSGAQIIVAVISSIAVIAAAVITVRAGDEEPPPTPTQPSSTTPESPPTAERGTSLLSPAGIKPDASSTLPDYRETTYVAANTIDGDPQTAWSEGKDGPGIGASITWTFPRRVDLKRTLIVNGYAKGDLFHKNLRIRAVRVTTAQGGTTVTLRDTTRYQALGIRAGPTRFVRLSIVSVYGSQAYEDCLISEIEFFVADR